MKTYLMYNGFDSRLLSDDVVIKAKTGADACRKLLKQLNIPFAKIERSASNDVIIKAEPFTEKDGKRYKAGVKSWFKVYKEIDAANKTYSIY